MTARHEDLSAAASTTLERSASTVAHGTRTMRERRRRRATVSRERRGRASGSLARGRTDARGVPACRPCLARTWRARSCPSSAGATGEFSHRDQRSVASNPCV